MALDELSGVGSAVRARIIKNYVFMPAYGQGDSMA